MVQKVILAAMCALAGAATAQTIQSTSFNRTLYDLGTSAYFQATFHGLDRLAFLDLQETLLERVSQSAIGASDSIVYRDMDASRENGLLGYEARLLFDFSPDDATPASLLATTLSRDPETVIPVELFGHYTVSHATLLQCASPCGDNGMRAPEVGAESNAVSCTCACDPGWSTDMSQPFETFEYCSVAADTSDGGGTDMNGSTGNTSNGTTGWRPPVPAYPPPPPKSYENETGKTKIPLFKWIIIGVSVIILAILVFVLCKTRCCGLCGLCSLCGLCCSNGSSQSYKMPVAPQRVHVHAMHQPQYAFAAPPQYFQSPPQYFPAPPPPQQQEIHTPPATMAPLGQGFQRPHQ